VHLTIYGDFNCPFSALASARADVLLASGRHDIEWRAIQHDTAIPAAGEPVDGDTAVALATELATIRELSGRDLPLHLIVPPVRSNTALASAALAAAGGDADRLRRRLFTAVWAEGVDVGDPAELHRLGADDANAAAARAWQDAFDALPQPMTPTLVLPDGHVEPGLGALERLADLATTDPQAR
jgi:2-hydroxychromene-2-carboxylate isomerase